MIRTSLSFIALLSLVACVGCTKPKQTTAVGAAAGGAIGAGLGAIIGNQTGNAGSGVAIGAVAGAATGALVANALQAQQESLRSQNEALERQERLLKVQRSEITELRNMNPDIVEQKRIALQRRGPEPTPYRSAALRSANPFTRTDVTRARLNPKTLAPSSIRRSPADVKPSVAKLKEPSRVKMVKSEQKPETAIINQKPIKPLLADPLVEEQTEELSETTRVVEQEPQSSCEDTTTEQRAARAAADPSDKLLHLRKALRLCPDSAELHHELGKVYSSMNRSADASSEFEEALRVDPTFKAAKSALNELKSAEIDQRF
jgi:hypothetical protein